MRPTVEEPCPVGGSGWEPRSGQPVKQLLPALGHDFGVRQNEKLPSNWTQRCLNWRRSRDSLCGSPADWGGLPPGTTESGPFWQGY